MLPTVRYWVLTCLLAAGIQGNDFFSKHSPPTSTASTWKDFNTINKPSNILLQAIFHPTCPSNSPPSSPSPSHWHPDRPDPYTCEYLGQNNCWQPSLLQSGPPYTGFSAPRPPRPQTCIVPTLNNPLHDDAPSIRSTFATCNSNAHIIFKNTTYHIHTVLNTTGLQNLDIEILGTLKWDASNITYWRTHSLPIGFQNQTSAWHLGGTQLNLTGHGVGTLDGNGQKWYEYNAGRSNLHGRPHALTLTDTTDSVVSGLRFWRSQMWSLTIIRSERVLLTDIHVDNRCDRPFYRCNPNTDGADVLYANNITLSNWTVHTADDAVAIKQNSTNIFVTSSTFYGGNGMTFGSLAQYPGQMTTIANVTARDIRVVGTEFGCRLKTWTGRQKGYPPNGGGGGVGFARNVTCEGFQMEGVGWAWSVNQRTDYRGELGWEGVDAKDRGKGWDSSRFRLHDFTFQNSHGTLRGNDVTAFQCSGAAPCQGMTVRNNSFTVLDTGKEAKGYRCRNLAGAVGFTCTDGCGDDMSLCPS